eukprot:TRINITY_DN8021_c0_g1_i1.p1 TRINITY_DN8021_c0_g1~~TRINITY_DN8021_c0_g1_i1.p1  ORF type:complete len:213 (-),score=25.25 TRINITY_DN8021_c0_g1_i1:264-818(-)
MSSLVRRPPLPVPGKSFGLMDNSSAIFRTEGASPSTTTAFCTANATFCAAGAAIEAIVVFKSDCLTSALCCCAFRGLSSCLIVSTGVTNPSTSPTATVLPFPTRTSIKIPEAGALISTVTLSVSSSTKISSTFTGSPTDFNQRATVASRMDSPNAGTLTSLRPPDDIFSSLSLLNLTYGVNASA